MIDPQRAFFWNRNYSPQTGGNSILWIVIIAIIVVVAILYYQKPEIFTNLL